MRISVRMKLLGLAGILLGMMALVGVLAITNLGSVNTQGQALYTNQAASLSKLGNVTTLIVDEQRLVIRGVPYVGDAAEQANIDKGIADDDAAIALQFQGYTVTDAKEGAALDPGRRTSRHTRRPATRPGLPQRRRPEPLSSRPPTTPREPSTRRAPTRTISWPRTPSRRRTQPRPSSRLTKRV